MSEAGVIDQKDLSQVEGGAGLRPDERAAGRPHARRPLGPRHDRVLPRREEPGRAPLHRQHLPLLAGRLRGVRAPRPLALGRRLPADARQRDGRPPGAHHLDQEGLDHLRAGRLRARGRSHRPGAGEHLRPPGLDDRARALHRRARHLSGGRSARLGLEGPRGLASSARSTTASPASSSACSSATRTSRTSSRSSASTSSRPRTSSRSTAPARSSASSRSRSRSPRSSPARPASTSPSRRPSAASR